MDLIWTNFVLEFGFKLHTMDLHTIQGSFLFPGLQKLIGRSLISPSWWIWLQWDAGKCKYAEMENKLARMRLLRAVSKMVSVKTVMQHLKNPPLEAQDFAKFDVSYKNFVQVNHASFCKFRCILQKCLSMSSITRASCCKISLNLNVSNPIKSKEIKPV